MLFRNGLIENATEGVDIRVLDGKFAAIAPNLEPLPGEEIIDCTGKLILPPLSNPTFIWTLASPPVSPVGT